MQALTFLALLCVSVVLTGCQPLSEKVTDTSAGINGGFEVVNNGLPVNWLMYTPRTVDDGEFKIILDRDVVKEGQQSLRFDVEQCSAVGGWRSPGFTNEFAEVGKFRGPAQYRLSFWINNEGAEYVISAGGVAAKTGDMRVLVRDAAPTDGWQNLAFTISVADGQWLRMQLNILSPGTFRMDAVEIDRLD